MTPDPWALLREAQRLIAANRLMLGHYSGGREVGSLEDSIDAALAAHRDEGSTEDIVDWSESEGWMQVSRANLPGRRLRVGVFSKHEWEWETVCRGRCATEAEAKAAAIAAARGLR